MRKLRRALVFAVMFLALAIATVVAVPTGVTVADHLSPPPQTLPVTAAPHAPGVPHWVAQPAPPPTTTTTAPAPPAQPQAVSAASTPAPAEQPQVQEVYTSGGCDPDEDYALDATTTDTPDWNCIRIGECGYGAAAYTCYSGAYGTVGVNSGAWPPAEQDANALRLYAQNHDHFSGCWNDRYTASEGGPLQ